MNKQEKNIVDVLTFDEIEDIVDIFIDKVYHTDKTVALITDKELVEYAMDELLNDDIFVRRVDLELEDEDAEYMISVDDDNNMVVQPVEYYDDKYFNGIEYAFVDMDGIVEQTTIDALLDMNVPVVLFGYDDECKCTCKKDEKPVTTSTKSTDKSIYRVNGKEVSKEDYEKALNELDEKYLDNIQNMLLNYFEFVDEMNKWRKLLRW